MRGSHSRPEAATCPPYVKPVMQLGNETMGNVMSFISPAAAFAGRVLLVCVFLLEGWHKLNGYSGAVAYMQKFGLPGELLPVAILVEVAGSLLIVVGWQTRFAALALAGFSILAAAIFHSKLAVMNEALHFWKDIGLAGGFLLLVAFGPGVWSLDEKTGARRTVS
jgi:putative oxidoreductase